MRRAPHPRSRRPRLAAPRSRFPSFGVTRLGEPAPNPRSPPRCPEAEPRSHPFRRGIQPRGASPDCGLSSRPLDARFKTTELTRCVPARPSIGVPLPEGREASKAPTLAVVCFLYLPFGTPGGRACPLREILPLKALSECWQSLPSWRGLLSLWRGPQRHEFCALRRLGFEFECLAGTKVLSKLS